MIDNITTAPKKKLTDLLTQASDLRRVLDSAPDVEKELQRREKLAAAENREKEREAKLAELRESEEAAAIKLTKMVDECANILMGLSTIRTDIRAQGGGVLNNSVGPSLSRGIDAHIELIRRTHPTWLGLPPAKTRHALAVEDAELQVAQAEKRLAHARQVQKDAPQQNQAHKSLVERAERSLKLAKDRLRTVKGAK